MDLYPFLLFKEQYCSLAITGVGNLRMNSKTRAAGRNQLREIGY